jgi:hypothetical protein
MVGSNGSNSSYYKVADGKKSEFLWAPSNLINPLLNSYSKSIPYPNSDPNPNPFMAASDVSNSSYYGVADGKKSDFWAGPSEVMLMYRPTLSLTLILILTLTLNCKLVTKPNNY